MADHDFDFELIMALAEGALDPAAAEAAEAGLDAAAREELAIQRMAIAAMADVPEATMTDTERSSIRGAVRAELNLEPVAVHSASGSIARPWYVRFMPALGAAAALVVVAGVGLGGIFPMGGDDADSDDSGNTIAAEAAANQSQLSGDFDAAGGDAAEAASAEVAESTAESMAATAADGSDGDALRDAPADEPSADSPADDTADDTAAPAEEAEAADTTAATEAPADDETAGFIPFQPIGDAISSAPGEVEEVMTVAAEQASGDPIPFGETAFYFADIPGATCWEDAALAAAADGTELVSVLVAGFGTLDGRPAEFYEFESDPANVIVVVARDTCEELLILTR